MDNRKASLRAACGCVSKDKNDRWVTEYPVVDCSYNCKHCGWNPSEAKRRMETGYYYVDTLGRKTLCFHRA